MDASHYMTNEPLTHPLAVTFTLSETEALGRGGTLSKLQQRYSGTASSYYVPIGLGVLLIAAARLSGVRDAAEFFPMLAAGATAYVAGLLAVQYEMKRYWRERTLDLYRNNSAYREPCSVTLCEDTVVVHTACAEGRYSYTGISKAAVVDDLVVIWLSGTPEILAPVRAFADAGSAKAFARDICRRCDLSKVATS
jgi:hypothetical protein